MEDWGYRSSCGSRGALVWLPAQSAPLERYTGFEPVQPVWKTGMLTVEHQYRIYWKLFYAYRSRFANLSPPVVIKGSAVHGSMVPVTRFELVRGLASTDFKSVASACSAIPASTRLLSYVGLEPTKIFVTEKIYYPIIWNMAVRVFLYLIYIL